MHLFYQPDIPNGSHFLDVEESRHCIKVLRMSVGDRINITDGKGTFYEAIITVANSKKCEFEIIDKKKQKKPPFQIEIALAPTKSIDRVEWFVEKCVELGVDGIHFIKCAHSERNNIKMERVERIAISAMKQSMKAWKPDLGGLVPFKQFVQGFTDSQKFIAHVDRDNPVSLFKSIKPGTDVIVLIGPEGDFTNEEVSLSEKHGFIKVSLGNSRLRTETAGIDACTSIHLANEIH